MPDSSQGQGRDFSKVGVSEPLGLGGGTPIQLLKRGGGHCFLAELKPLYCPFGHSHDACAGVFHEQGFVGCAGGIGYCPRCPRQHLAPCWLCSRSMVLMGLFEMQGGK